MHGVDAVDDAGDGGYRGVGVDVCGLCVGRAADKGFADVCVRSCLMTGGCADVGRLGFRDIVPATGPHVSNRLGRAIGLNSRIEGERVPEPEGCDDRLAGEDVLGAIGDEPSDILCTFNGGAAEAEFGGGRLAGTEPPANGVSVLVPSV